VAGKACTAEQLDCAVQKFKRLEQKVQETELFRQFIKTMMIDCLSITAMTAGRNINTAENINDKAGHVATGYLAWFRAVAEAAAYLEREVVWPVAERLQGK
jgi:hypothetical protein